MIALGAWDRRASGPATLDSTRYPTFGSEPDVNSQSTHGQVLHLWKCMGDAWGIRCFDMFPWPFIQFADSRVSPARRVSLSTPRSYAALLVCSLSSLLIMPLSSQISPRRNNRCKPDFTVSSWQLTLVIPSQSQCPGRAVIVIVASHLVSGRPRCVEHTGRSLIRARFTSGQTSTVHVCTLGAATLGTASIMIHESLLVDTTQSPTPRAMVHCHPKRGKRRYSLSRVMRFG